jgi:hypothetical protein
MKLVCSKCGSIILDDASDRIITHGICDECAGLLLWPHRPALMDFLDTLEVPVVVIDATAHICNANSAARAMLHKELAEIAGLPGGNVFECAFASLPEGCGNTLHCDGCTIRRTVLDTMQTGRSHLKIPAGLFLGAVENRHEIQLLISTEKADDVVMLRIDTISEE